MTRLRTTLALALFFGLGTACGPDDSGGCSKDTDCASGRICSSRQCVDRTSGTGAGGSTGNPTSGTGGGGGTTSSTGTGAGGCTSDGQCKGRCVSGKCVDCKTSDDCRTMGQCYEVSRSGCLGSSDCPGQLSRATCSSNKCSCPNVYPTCGSEICGWKFH